MNRSNPYTESPLTGTWQPLRYLFDSALAIGTLVVTVVVSVKDPNQYFADGTAGDIPITAYVLFAVASGALLWRRSRPLLVLGVILSASAVSMALGYFDGPLVAAVVALYSAGRYAHAGQLSYTLVGGAIALIGISEFMNSKSITAMLTAELGFAFVASFGLWYIGRRIRVRGEFVGLLQERAAYLEKQQAAESRRAVAEERTRIARELHDVVAHRVSLMTVQAGAATTVAANDPKAALQAMKEVEKEGRQALSEMRHLMGVLRPHTNIGELGPQPNIADLPLLVDNLKKAGLEIALNVDVAGADLPARVELSTYRIVQEALTNVLKHAGPGTRTEVRISVHNGTVAIEVLDNGSQATILPGSGLGLVGMRERVQLLGGSLDVGPRSDGGFQVVALLPNGETQ